MARLASPTNVLMILKSAVVSSQVHGNKSSLYLEITVFFTISKTQTL